MADQWYVRKGGKKHGPFTNEQLKKLAATGKIDRTDQLWKEGMEKWVPCSSAKGLFVAAAPASLAPPPPAFDNPLAAPDSDDPTAAFSGFEMPAYVPTPEEPPPLKPAEPPATSGYTPVKKASRQLEYADFGQRVGGAVIDNFVSAIFATPLIVLCFASKLIDITDKSQQSEGALMIQGIVWLTAFVYGTLLDSGRQGATFGKRAMSIRVTDVEGRRVGIGRAMLRQFIRPFSFFLFAGILLSFVTKRKQTLHDLISGTVVVKT